MELIADMKLSVPYDILLEPDNFSNHLPKVWIQDILFLCKQTRESISATPFATMTFVQAHWKWHIGDLHIDTKTLKKFHHVWISYLSNTPFQHTLATLWTRNSLRKWTVSIVQDHIKRLQPMPQPKWDSNTIGLNIWNMNNITRGLNNEQTNMKDVPKILEYNTTLRKWTLGLI